MALMDLCGSNVDLPCLYGTHMGSIWVLRGTTEPLFKHYMKISRFPDINANNNDNNKIKIIVCSLQNYKMKLSVKFILTIFPAFTLIHGQIFILTRMSLLCLKLRYI